MCCGENYQTHTTSSCVGMYTLSIMMGAKCGGATTCNQNGQFWGGCQGSCWTVPRVNQV